MQPPVPVLSEFYTLARIGAPRTFTVEMQSTKHRFTTRCSSVTCRINLPGWRWARIKQLALVGSSSSRHSEACKALGGSFGVVHSKISVCGSSRSRGSHPQFKLVRAFFVRELRDRKRSKTKLLLRPVVLRRIGYCLRLLGYAP